MKFILTSLTLFLSTLTLFAQVPLNKTVYDCDSVSKNIHDVLGTGKAIIIARKGVDCPICKNAARGLQTWAANNKAKVEVWAAMTYRYNPNSFSPQCVETKKWDSTYAWDDIFAFPDSARDWVDSQGGFPRYYVYSALDSTIVFQGSSSSVAQDSALNHSKISVGINEFKSLANVKVIYQSNQLILKGLTNNQIQLSIFDLNGRNIYKQRIIDSEVNIDATNLKKGIYILRVQSSNNKIESRKLFIH